MSDEINVNSENTPRKNLATLGQVKDALNKRDKKIDSLKEEMVDLKENPVVKVDDTLTQEGMAADAKTVGEKISLITGDVVDEGIEATLHTLIYGDDTANF